MAPEGKHDDGKHGRHRQAQAKLFITKNKEWDIQQHDEYAEGNPCQLGKKQRHTGHTAVNDVVRYKKQIQPR